MQMLLFLAVLCLTGAVLAGANLATLPARARRDRIRTAATYGSIRVQATPERSRFRERALGPFVTSLARGMLRLNPRQNVDAVSKLLVSAGMRDTSPYAFLAAKAAGAVAGVVAGILFGVAASPGMLFLFAGVLGLIGYMLPGIVVGGRAKRRQEQITAQLPDALDLLAVSVEAGLGFDAAVSKLTQHMQGPLPREFELALGEMRIGEGRSEALKKLSDRIDTAEVTGFVRAIIQADQLGTSLGRILRVQATDTRLKRQAAAEEKAMKAPIKMLIPTVIFIFPVMFIVVLGPALLNIGKLFGGF
jgi:tight adherence protein C